MIQRWGRGGLRAAAIGVREATLVALLAGALSTLPASALSAPSAADGGAAEFTVADVRFRLSTANPALLDSLEFTVSGATPRTVSISLTDDAAVWYACRASGPGGHWHCPTTGAPVRDATRLTVSALP